MTTLHQSQNVVDDTDKSPSTKKITAETKSVPSERINYKHNRTVGSNTSEPQVYAAMNSLLVTNSVILGVIYIGLRPVLGRKVGHFQRCTGRACGNVDR